MMKEAFASNLIGASDTSTITRPPRHVTWKRARQRPFGEYTSKKTTSIARRIDELVEQNICGTFTPEGREDILAVDNGRLELSRLVRGVGDVCKATRGSGGQGRCRVDWQGRDLAYGNGYEDFGKKTQREHGRGMSTKSTREGLRKGERFLSRVDHHPFLGTRDIIHTKEKGEASQPKERERPIGDIRLAIANRSSRGK
ncbi:hypothetical protein LR48_Vigan08g058900 [Vigna angularis]|uniref:Uncharacterized protein n=1 Tax=Phaseolus angularis TaxID=3914 RepID=A0A0L9V494_PHAAN|nr:hypothetical protein LR48_Vigan08g058900 [Vigna angularis]